jgi:pimeloyl-ACP methyl ester carboxylesterase
VTVAKNVDSRVLKDCGHSFPEEHPEEIVRHVQALKARTKHLTRLQ